MKDLVIRRLVRRSGKNGKGVYVIYFRFQIVWDGVRCPYFESSTKITVDNLKKWDQRSQVFKGSSDEIRRLNKEISNKQNAVESFWDEFRVTTKSAFNFHRLKDLINAKMGGRSAVKQNTLAEVFIPTLFDLHIEAGKPKGGMYNYARKNRYRFIKSLMNEYCMAKYKTANVPLEKLGKPFYLDFRSFLQKKLDLHQSTLQGYMKVFEAAVNSEWSRGEYTFKNPLTGCHTDGGKTRRTALTLSELTKIKSLSGDQIDDGTELARDIFLFVAYTGISYSDLRTLTSDYIQILEGDEYLVKDREKNVNHSNSNFFSVPITKDVKMLLSKFEHHPTIAGTNRLIPVTSNSDYNKKLKLIKAHCGIKKPLSSHIARHTMACLFLEAGGSMEVLMKLLGHSRLSQTQAYGKITASRVTKEVRDALEYISNRDAKVIPISSKNKNAENGTEATGG